MSESKCILAKCVILIIGVVAALVVMLALVVHFTSTGNDDFNFDQGANTANVHQSSGIHLLEVNSTDNELSEIKRRLSSKKVLKLNAIKKADINSIEKDIEKEKFVK